MKYCESIANGDLILPICINIELLYFLIQRRFTLEVYREYYILNNDNSTRSFVCLPIEDRSGLIAKLIETVDTVMRNFRLPEYYEVISNEFFWFFIKFSNVDILFLLRI
jgi:hypothetical protein